MTISAAQANQLLINEPAEFASASALRNLVSQLSTEAPGNVTITYSGAVADGIWSGDVIKWLKANSPDARLIDNTELAKFLEGNLLKNQVNAVFGSDSAIRGTPANDFLIGNPKTSLWAIGSGNFIDGAEGSVRSIAPFADPSRVWSQTEFQRFLESPKVTDNWGVSREKLVGFRDSLIRIGVEPGDALSATRDLTTFISRAKMGAIQYTTDAAGKINWVDTSKLLGDSASVKPVPADAIPGKFGDAMGPLSKSEAGSLGGLSGALNAAGNNQSFWKAVGVTEAGLGVIGAFALGFTAASAAIAAKEALDNGDPVTAQTIIRDWSLGTVGAMAAGGFAFTGTVWLLAPLAVLGPLGIGAALLGALGTSLLAAYWGHKAGVGFGESISNAVNAGLNWFLRRDPLILDLDGDGIELTASSSSVLFDHNADGIKTGSQWAKSDDGMLVRDLNGNGTIDSGRELFGDQTLLPNGSLAINGFQALSALDKDANGVADGIFNANDVAYADLKVWRDLNQDGVSQSNELLGLAEYGVSAINLTLSATQVTQGKSTFTKTVSGVDANGNPVSFSTEQTVQNVNFTQNAFYREFSDNPVVTAAAALLPQMQGAGLVRDLREAMSLGTVQAVSLQTSLGVFTNTSTAQAQVDQINVSACSADFSRIAGDFVRVRFGNCKWILGRKPVGCRTVRIPGSNA